MNFNPKISPWLALALLAASCALLTPLLVRKAMFPAPPPSYGPSKDLLQLYAGGRKLAARFYKCEATENPWTILYSHGNAEDIGELDETAKDFVANGFSFFCYDYGGYGLSEGKSGQRECLDDIQAAYGFLVSELKVPPGRVIVYGRSLGSGPSAWLAAQGKGAALVIESGFSSALAVVFGVDGFPFDKFQNIKALKKIEAPVLVMHGRQDEVIAFRNGEKLRAAAKNALPPLWVESAGHNDLREKAGEAYWRSLRELRERLEASKRAGTFDAR